MHTTIAGAARCQDDDRRGCEKQGGYSDRALWVVEDGKWRRADEAEMTAFSHEQGNNW